MFYYIDPTIVAFSDYVSGIVSITVSFFAFKFLKKEFSPEKKEKELEKKEEEGQNFSPSDRWEEIRTDKEVLKEEIRIAKAKYREYEADFKKRDLKSLSIITFCITVIGFLLTLFLSGKDLDLLLVLAMVIGIFIFFKASVNAAKVLLRPKNFGSIGSEPSKVLFERDMDPRTLMKYDIIFDRAILDIEEKDGDFKKSIDTLLIGVSILMGIVSLTILKELPISDYLRLLF